MTNRYNVNIVDKFPTSLYLEILSKCAYIGKEAKMAEEKDEETTFSPTNSSKDHLNAEQTPQNNL